MRSTVNDVQTVRLFIAIDLPPDILKEIDRLVTYLKKKRIVYWALRSTLNNSFDLTFFG